MVVIGYLGDMLSVQIDGERMSRDKDLKSDPQNSVPAKQPTLQISEMLTPEEIEALRQDLKEGCAQAMKAFEDVKPVQ